MGLSNCGIQAWRSLWSVRLWALGVASVMVGSIVGLPVPSRLLAFSPYPAHAMRLATSA